jgi:hypothetical protein
MLTLINPTDRAEPFDHADWIFEAKFDGFRAAADTIRGRLISRTGNRMQRFEGVLDLLPKGHVFDGGLVVLGDAGYPCSTSCCSAGGGRPTWPSTCRLPTALICGGTARRLPQGRPMPPSVRYTMPGPTPPRRTGGGVWWTRRVELHLILARTVKAAACCRPPAKADPAPAPRSHRAPRGRR